MPCICGEVTCICFYVCACRSPSCLCQACIILRDSRQQAVIQSPSKQNHSAKKSGTRKKSFQRSPSNKQTSSSVNESPSEQSQMNRSASASIQLKEILDSSPAMKPPKPPSSADPHATLKKQLSQPALPSNYDPHPTLRRQLSQPAPSSNDGPCPILRRQLSQPARPSNDDKCPILKKRLSEPCKIPMSGNLFSELQSSVFNRNPSSTDGSGASSLNRNNPYLPSISKTGSSTTTSTRGFKSSNSANSRNKNIQTTHSDFRNSCASIEYIKKASDKALPSHESFSSRFTTQSSDENNNRDFGLNKYIPTSQNQDTRQTSNDLSGRSTEIHTPLHPEISGASSASSYNDSQLLYSSDYALSELSPQEHPLNLSLSSEDKHKISVSQSTEASSRSLSPVPAKQQRTDSMDFSNIPTKEYDNHAASFSGRSSGTFSTRQRLSSSDSATQRSYPTESAASTSGNSSYISCIIRNPSQNPVDTGQHESPMETETSSKNVDQNLAGCPSSAPSTSNYFPPHFSQASAPNIITYCNDLNDGRNFTLRTTSSDLHNLQDIQSSQPDFTDLNRFSETSENPYVEHGVFSPSGEQTSSTDRQSVIRYSSSRSPSQSTSAFSPYQTTDPVNIPYQAQSHQASSSTFPSSMNLSDARLLASRICNETDITSQDSAFFHPTSSEVNMVPAFGIAASTESMESYPSNRENLLPHPQSSILQNALSGITPAQTTTNYSDEDETDESSYSSREVREN